MDQIINFKINTELFTSRSEAILALENIIFTQGEPVIAIYGTTSQNAKIILAVGKRNGAGKNAFEIISTKEDMSETLNIINSLNNEFTEHIKAEAGDKLGHVITGGDIVFSGGIGTVVSAGKVKNKLTFTGGTFEGTRDRGKIVAYRGSEVRKTAGAAGKSRAPVFLLKNEEIYRLITIR